MNLPQATRLSVHNGQLLISTGIPSLDELLGGGLPIGSILLVKEDQTGIYGQLMLKYFLSGALACPKHHAFLGTSRPSVQWTQEFLGWQGMSVKTSGDAEVKKEDAPWIEDESLTNTSSEGMRIAWRYTHQPAHHSQQQHQEEIGLRVPAARSRFQKATQRSYHSETKEEKAKPEIVAAAVAYTPVFDLQATTPSSLVDEARDRLHESDGLSYANLLFQLEELVHRNFTISPASPLSAETPVLRIGLKALGHPSWNEDPQNVPKFLQSLRGLLRYSVAACIITVPSNVFTPAFDSRLDRLADAVVALRAFDASDHPYYRKEYHGSFSLVKLPRLNTLLEPQNQLGLDLAFKCRRRRFCIETVHLPPELGESTTTGCSTSSTPPDMLSTNASNNRKGISNGFAKQSKVALDASW